MDAKLFAAEPTEAPPATLTKWQQKGGLAGLFQKQRISLLFQARIHQTAHLREKCCAALVLQLS